MHDWPTVQFFHVAAYALPITAVAWLCPSFFWNEGVAAELLGIHVSTAIDIPSAGVGCHKLCSCPTHMCKARGKVIGLYVCCCM